jgi:hypothetical protein
VLYSNVCFTPVLKKWIPSKCRKLEPLEYYYYYYYYYYVHYFCLSRDISRSKILSHILWLCLMLQKINWRNCPCICCILSTFCLLFQWLILYGIMLTYDRRLIPHIKMQLNEIVSFVDFSLHSAKIWLLPLCYFPYIWIR